MIQNNLPKWGVWICAGWSVALAMLALTTLLQLTWAAGLYSDVYGSQARIWLVFALNVAFSLAFIASAYGLWRQLNWGRLLFLWTIIVWSGFNLLAVLLRDVAYTSAIESTTGDVTVNTIRFTLGLVLPFLFLNLPRVKALFYNTPSDF